MKKRRNNSDRASTLQVALATGLLSMSAVLLAIASPTNTKQAPRQHTHRSQRAESADSIPTLGNYPDTSVPLSTNTTVTPDAAPANTTSINVSTSTDFKGIFAASPTTGVVRVTDAHPAGTYMVTVRAFNGSGPTTARTFTLTVTTPPPPCNPVSFAATRSFETGQGAYTAAVGDFNGDGKQDVAVANYYDNNVSILLGDGAGNFSDAINFAVGTNPQSIAVGDFNGDGKQDLAVANYVSGNVSILLGDGAGHFSAPTNFGAGDLPTSVAVGDFNGDGKQDLAVANRSSDNVSILLGDGAGHFSAPTNFAAGTFPESVAVGDFNGDGKQDLAVANDGSNNVSILLGDGAGNFSAPGNFGAGAGPQSVAVGDFNGDGKQDLALGNYQSSNVSILLGDGTGHFGPFSSVGANTGPYIAVGDFNSDGKQDIAVTGNGSTDYVSILLGDGTGNFSAPINTVVNLSPYSVAVGDFNGDGRQDLAVADIGSNDVSILLRQGCSSPTPTATATATGTPLPPPSLGNYPDRSIPLSTDAVVMPDATPASITSLTASTSTNFKGHLEGYPATGVVRVTDAHPAGTYTITVTAFTSGILTATRTFTLTVTTPATCNPVSFAAPRNFGAGGVSYSLALGDFNGDGRQDLVMNQSGSVSVVFGDGAGNFSGPTIFSVAGNSFSVAVGDFNGDGKQDLAVSGGSYVSILLGDGAGHFSAPTTFATDASRYSVAVGDFNGDGKQDLALGGAGPYVSILLGDGAGNFNDFRSFPAGFDGLYLAVGDFNNDGKQDLAVVDDNYPSINTVSVLLGDGAGNFGAPRTFTIGRGGYYVTVGNFNGDGNQDLVVTNAEANTVSILLGNGAGSFSAAPNFGGGADPGLIVVGDFNGDGRQDLAVPNPGSAYVSILLGDGAGGISGGDNFFLDAAGTVVVGDFNGDGLQDLAVTSGSNVSILLRQCPPPSPTPSPTPTATATPTATPPPPILGNYSNASILLSSDTTVTPDVAPTNTTSINVSTSSSFQGKLEGYPATGVVRVTDAHPAGTYTVTVRALNGGGSTTTRTFMLTVTTVPMCTQMNFTGASYGVGLDPESVAVGDFNGDGLQDLAVANAFSGDVSILLGDGSGHFSAGTYFEVGARPSSVAVGDFNGDGRQDLAVANGDSNNVSILLGDGTGHFSAATYFTAGSVPNSVAVGDFNRDGRQDLAVANSGSNNVSILLGDGTGHFSAPINFAAGTGPHSVAVGDFNRDDKQDLVVANVGSNNVSILLGDGAGNFSAPTNYVAGTSPESVAVGDFDGDGKQDLAVANSGSSCVGTVSIFLGDGFGNFSPARTFNVGNGTGPFSIAVGDFNADNKQDLAVADGCRDPGIVTVLFGDGAGNFNTSSAFGTGSAPHSVAVGDFTGDGKQDLAVANHTSDNVSILVRYCVASPSPRATATATATATYTPTTTPTPTPATPTPIPSPTPSPTPCGTLLYDQTSNAGTTTIVSQNFEPANDAFDSLLADDFVVPAGPAWTIQQVNVSGLYFNGPGPATSVNVTFYFNSGTLPGAAVPGGTYNNLPMIDTAGNFSIALPSNLVLTPGTYWVSVQANMDFNTGGEWGWLDRKAQSNSPAAWQNPGGAFGFGCLTWGARGATCGIDPQAPDQVFQLVGCVAAPSPTPTPTPIFISGTISYCSNPALGPVPGVTMILTGSSSAVTTTDANGNYTFAGLASGGSYTVTPTKTALTPGAPGINTTDAVAVQRHFLAYSLLTGCRLAAADVNGDASVNTLDVLAVTRFFLGQTTGIANVGTYVFNPANKSYSPLASNQAGQNYDALILGDVAPGFVDRPEGRPSQDGASAAELPPTVATLSLPNVAVDSFVTNLVTQVTTTNIGAENKLVGFQGDFTFDERVIIFQEPPVQKAGLTGGNWSVSGNVLPGAGPIRTLRISAFSFDFAPLSGTGTLFELRMLRMSQAAQATPLLWAAPPEDFIFIDADLNPQQPGNAEPGSVTTSGKRR